MGKRRIKLEIRGLDLKAVWENLVSQVGQIQLAAGKTIQEQIEIEDKKEKLNKLIEKQKKEPEKKFKPRNNSNFLNKYRPTKKNWRIYNG